MFQDCTKQRITTVKKGYIAMYCKRHGGGECCSIDGCAILKVSRRADGPALCSAHGGFGICDQCTENAVDRKKYCREHRKTTVPSSNTPRDKLICTYTNRESVHCQTKRKGSLNTCHKHNMTWCKDSTCLEKAATAQGYCAVHARIAKKMHPPAEKMKKKKIGRWDRYNRSGEEMLRLMKERHMQLEVEAETVEVAEEEEEEEWRGKWAKWENTYKENMEAERMVLEVAREEKREKRRVKKNMRDKKKRVDKKMERMKAQENVGEVAMNIKMTCCYSEGGVECEMMFANDMVIYCLEHSCRTVCNDGSVCKNSVTLGSYCCADHQQV